MKRIGLRADPWGTPELILMSGDCWLFIVKYVYLSLRKLYMNFRNWMGIFLDCSVCRRPVCQTLSDAFSTSMNTDAHIDFLRFFDCIPICVS